MIFRFLKQINIFNNNNVISRVHFHKTVQIFAGHSKWANIKHTKSLKDGQKAVQFQKFIRQIRLAIQEKGSADPAMNTTLRNAMDLAIRKNVPMSTIQNAIKKTEQSSNKLKKHVIEVRALNKIYMVCVLYTDNLVGLKMLITPILKKTGATFTDARHLFDEKGIINAQLNESETKKIKDSIELDVTCTTDAIDCGAEEIDIIDESTGNVNFICDPGHLESVENLLRHKGYQIESSEHLFMPKKYINITPDELKLYETFRNKLKANDGVEEIFDNIDADID